MLNRISICVLLIITMLFSVNLTNSDARNYNGKNSLTGKWTGELNAGGNVLRIVFNIIQDDDENFSATLDSPDQNAIGIPVTEIICNNNLITLIINAVAGKYEGEISTDGQSMTGTWSQGTVRLPLNMTKETNIVILKEDTIKKVPDAVDLQRIIGRWMGKLKINNIGKELRLVFDFSEDSQNGIYATLSSPDQRVNNIPVSNLEFSNNHLMIEIKIAGAQFEGIMAEDNSAVEGTWSQRGNSLPLILRKTEEDAVIQELKRPQEPRKPYAYVEEDVVFKNENAGVKLAGTLTIPVGEGPFPAVVLISGSGPQDRNESFMMHKPFLVWADYLTKNNIAVLRYDDRGFGKSTGDFSSATSMDFVRDAISAVDFLKTRKEINPQKIGLVGHSEGGLIAPIAAVQSPDIAYIILMAGPGLKGSEVLLTQQKAILKANGISNLTISAMQELNSKLFEIVRSEKNDSSALHKLKLTAKEFTSTLDTNIIQELKNVGTDINEEQLSRLLSPWFRYFIEFNPQQWLEQVVCPVLALNGSKDVQVTAEENLAGISKALNEGGNKNYTVKELPGLNHLFQHAEKGTLDEYSKIEETISPEVLKIMSDWIEMVCK